MIELSLLNEFIKKFSILTFDLAYNDNGLSGVVSSAIWFLFNLP